MPLNKDQHQSMSLQKKALMLGLGILARRWVKELRSALCVVAAMSFMLIVWPASVVFFGLAMMASAGCVVLLGQQGLGAIGLIGKSAPVPASVGPILDFISGAPFALPLIGVAVIAIASVVFKKRPIEQGELGKNQSWILRISAPLIRPCALALMRALNALGRAFDRCFAPAAQSDWEARESALCVVAWALIALLSCFFGLAFGVLGALNIVGFIVIAARGAGAMLLYPIRAMGGLKERGVDAQPRGLIVAMSLQKKALMLGLGMLARRWVKELRSSLRVVAVMSLMLIVWPASVGFFGLAMMASAGCVVLLGQQALGAIGLIEKSAPSSASVGPILDFISGAPFALPLMGVAVIAIASAVFKKRPIEQGELGKSQSWILRITAPLIRPSALALMRAFNALERAFDRCFTRADQSDWEASKSALCVVAWALVALLACFFGLAFGVLGILNLVGFIPVAARGVGAVLLYPIRAMGGLKERGADAPSSGLVVAMSLRSGRAKAWASGKIKEIATEGAQSKAFALAEKADLEKTLKRSSKRERPKSRQL